MEGMNLVGPICWWKFPKMLFQNGGHLLSRFFSASFLQIHTHSKYTPKPGVPGFVESNPFPPTPIMVVYILV